MYRIFLLFIITSLTFIRAEFLFAEGCDIRSDLPTHAELIGPVEQCIQARSQGKPNSITEFNCPQGNFFAGSDQSITPETLAYLIGVNISFNKIDADINKYMRKLQEIRESDPIMWIANIRSCTEKIQSIYASICGFGAIETILNEGTKKYISTTNAYPQSLCSATAMKKIQGWYYLQSILMSDSISKNQKNSTDKWVTEVKGAYARVLQSWHNYKGILSTAVSKLTGLPKNSN